MNATFTTPKWTPTKMRKWLLEWGPGHFDASHPDWLTHWTFYDQAHADKPQPDDVAVVWQSGPDGGVVAIARFTDRPAYEAEVKPDSGFAPEYVGTIRWQRDLVGGRKLERPVPRSVLMDDPRFAGALIKKMPGGANPFPVRDAEWSALCEAIVLEFLQ
ncbi:MAG TPA: hypothetical protein VMU34_15255 [Mycobacterium sp.]|nr:hypothetical protein [Mycobacterium sp.]